MTPGAGIIIMTNQELKTDDQPTQNDYNQLLYAETVTEKNIKAPADVSRVNGY